MFGFSDLEENLMGDKGSEVQVETLSNLRAIGAEIQTALDNGLPAEDFTLAQGILAAVAAAEQILTAPIDTTGV